RLDLLVRAVQLDGLLISQRVEPVEEDAAARANGRLPAPERRPRHPAARAQVDAADVRLEFGAHAGAQRQLLARAVVVLDVDAHIWIAHVPRVRGRRAGGVRGQVGERERPVRVAPLIRSVAPGLELKAGLEGVLADGDVEVVADLGVERAGAAVDLRAAGVE